MTEPGSFGTVTTCRESPKQMREFVNYYLNLGASWIIIYFDDPHDWTISQFEKEPRVIRRICDEQHWHSLIGHSPISIEEAQICNIRQGISILKEKGVSWVASIDADELLHTRRRITDVLAAAEPQTDVIRVKPVEAIQHWRMDKALDFGSRYFRVPLTVPGSRQASVAKRFDSGRKPFAKAGLFGHLHGKLIFRSNLPIDEYRLHVVSSSTRELREIVIDDLDLLHFDAMNYLIWERKWMRRILGETVVLRASPRRRRQEEQIRRVYETSGRRGLERLFQEWHYLSPVALFALRRAGVVKRVTIPSYCFSGPVREIADADKASLGAVKSQAGGSAIT